MTGPVPEAFADYFAALDEQPTDALFAGCFGCGPRHPDGLRIRCFRTADGIAAPIVVPRRYEGPPGVAHGGIVAACLDEVLGGAAARATGRTAVTGELMVRYVRPVPTEAPVLGLGWLVADRGRYVEVEGRLVEFGTDHVLATARARFFPITPRKPVKESVSSPERRETRRGGPGPKAEGRRTERVAPPRPD